MTNERQLSNSGRFQISSDGTLIINGVSAQDIGLYKCHVISAGGNDSRMASLNVIGELFFPFGPCPFLSSATMFSSVAYRMITFYRYFVVCFCCGAGVICSLSAQAVHVS